ncbi:16973_t:CDS:10 [Rhizophagus irregularis]|nr:16973_t:CDS:10 [Rhizophagus irregularis]
MSSFHQHSQQLLLLKEFDNDPIENQDDSESKSIDSVNEPYNHISKSNVVEEFDNSLNHLKNQDDLEFTNINNELILKSNIIEDEDKNFCLEERNDIEQHNDLEISEDILLNSLIVENLTKSNTIEDKQDNLETPKEIDKSNNQFEIIEYNENTKPNLENQDCLNIYKGKDALI